MHDTPSSTTINSARQCTRREMSIIIFFYKLFSETVFWPSLICNFPVLLFAQLFKAGGPNYYLILLSVQRGKLVSILQRFLPTLIPSLSLFRLTKGDLIQSVGVFVAAIIIMIKPEWKIADPICTFLFSIIVMFTTYRIMKESILIIMESAPDHIDHQAVKLSLLNINGVKMIHNLYIWQLTVDNVVLTGHLVVTPNSNTEQVLQKARILLKEQYNITAATLQCERYQPQMLACDHCNEL